MTDYACASTLVNRYYGGLIPSFFNLCTMQGYLIINCIIGGQTLGSVSTHLNSTLGIVIISLISLAVGQQVYANLEKTYVDSKS